MKLGLHYSTTYFYAEAVAFSPHEVRLFPRGDHFSSVRRIGLKTEPEATIRYARDVFDNVVATCFFREKSDRLHLELEFEVELEPKDPFHFVLAKEAVEVPLEYDEDLRRLLGPYLQRSGDGLLCLPGWEQPTRERTRGTVTTLVELNHALHESIGYERREEGAARSSAETLACRRGACRDVAVLHADLLRQLGLAARLTSGYLRESDSEVRRAEGSLHAWTEVFLPGAGWVGLDGTNGSFCDHNFIVAAVGLSPADITPVSGSYYHAGPVTSAMTSKLELVNL